MVDPAQDQSKQLSGSAPDVQIILAEEIDRYIPSEMSLRCPLTNPLGHL